MSRLLPWIVVALALAVLVLLARQTEGLTGPLSSGEMASLLYKIGLVVLAGGAALAMFRNNFSQALTQAMIWVAVGLALVLGYSYRFELYDVGDRLMVELMPGRVMSRGHTVELARAGTGDFRIGTEVNGVRIAMVLDTGASSVVLTQDAARAAGLPVEVLTYTVPIDTANGRTRAAPVTLNSLAVGGIVERSVPALIAQPGQLRTNLLGMTFLNRLESWEVRGDKLVMRGYP